MRWALLVLVAVVLAGCGSKDDGGGFETPDKEGQYYMIHLTSDRTFDPEKAQVPAGALVSFHFGLEDCDVRSEEPGGPDSRGTYANGIYPRDETYNWPAPSQEAHFNIYCSRYSSMTGELKVG